MAERTAIPVVLNFDFDRPVGKATVDEDGDLVILVSGDLLIRHIEHLASLDLIRGLSLGVEYKIAQPEKE